MREKVKIFLHGISKEWKEDFPQECDNLNKFKDLCKHIQIETEHDTHKLLKKKVRE